MFISENEIKSLAKLKAKKERYLQKRFLVEGIRCVTEVLKSDYPIEKLLICESELTSTGENFKVEQNHIPKYSISGKHLKKISSAESSQGVIAVVGMRSESELDYSDESNLVLIAERISDPSNLGSLIRSCTAFNAKLIISSDSVDIYNPKVIRSSAGMIFNLEFTIHLELHTQLTRLKKKDFQIWGAEMQGKSINRIAKFPRNLALVIGNEAFGISENLNQDLDSIVSIPIRKDIESLSAPVAGGIMLYFLASKLRIID